MAPPEENLLIGNRTKSLRSIAIVDFVMRVEPVRV
jgi:hypothetical protein